MASTPSSEQRHFPGIKMFSLRATDSFFTEVLFVCVRHNSALGVRVFSDGHGLKQGMGWGAGPQHCLQEGSLH